MSLPMHTTPTATTFQVISSISYLHQENNQPPHCRQVTLVRKETGRKWWGVCDVTHSSLTDTGQQGCGHFSVTDQTDCPLMRNLTLGLGRMDTDGRCLKIALAIACTVCQFIFITTITKVPLVQVLTCTRPQII